MMMMMETMERKDDDEAMKMTSGAMKMKGTSEVDAVAEVVEG